MATYEVALRASVIKDLKRFGSVDRERCITAMRSLAQDPRPRCCEKLSTQERYRIRVGDYRVIYEVRDAQLIVWVVKVGHRRDVYRHRD